MLRTLLPVLLAVGALGGCRAQATTYTLDPGPPIARNEVVVYRPGQVWVQGRWERQGPRWVWRDGHHVRERPNMVYVAGHWERRGHRHVWIDGRWHPRSAVVIRDTRRF